MSTVEEAKPTLRRRPVRGEASVFRIGRGDSGVAPGVEALAECVPAATATLRPALVGAGAEKAPVEATETAAGAGTWAGVGVVIPAATGAEITAGGVTVFAVATVTAGADERAGDDRGADDATPAEVPTTAAFDGTDVTIRDDAGEWVAEVGVVTAAAVAVAVAFTVTGAVFAGDVAVRTGAGGF
eukprot:Opistho-2@90795